VEETYDLGRKTRTMAVRDNRGGISQGSPIAPPRANLYMRRFVLGWKMLGLEQSLGSRSVHHLVTPGQTVRREARLAPEIGSSFGFACSIRARCAVFVASARAWEVATMNQ
jgi:hypothetical protein